jgi:ring-1,2-phenylacetyl-CoA epoxidase subunit PaaD
MNVIETVPRVQYDRIQHRRSSLHAELWDLLDEVKDPELPVLSIWDLGILRDVQVVSGCVSVIITPTYSGCPAMDAIKEDIETLLNQKGYNNINVELTLSPAWTTDDMTIEGQTKLREYGIAPPSDSAMGCMKHVTPDANVKCPHCQSIETHLVSEFGSTACKALFQCDSCLEPFDFFKSI